jgi:hypothetical protein
LCWKVKKTGVGFEYQDDLKQAFKIVILNPFYHKNMESKMTIPVSETVKQTSRSRSVELLHSRQGQYCIYYQDVTISYGRLRSYRLNDNGVKIALEISPSQGLSDIREEIWFSSGWDDIEVSDRHIHFISSGWHLFFDPVLVQRVVQVAAQQLKAPAQERFLRLRDMLQGAIRQYNMGS